MVNNDVGAVSCIIDLWLYKYFYSPFLKTVRQLVQGIGR